MRTLRAQGGAWACAICVLLLATELRAREYDVELDDVTTAEELYELQQIGELDNEDLELLLGFLQRPLDLNRADRQALFELPGITLGIADNIIAHRRKKEFKSVLELRDVEGITERVFNSVKPFVTVQGDIREETKDLSGDLRAGSLWRRGFGRSQENIDERVEAIRDPQSFLLARGNLWLDYGFGLYASHVDRPDVDYNVATQRLEFDGRQNSPFLESGYFYGRIDAFRMIAGNYTVGFGERLTFDITNRRNPHGWYENIVVNQRNDDGRVSLQKSLRGAAVTMDGVEAPGGWVDATAFVSVQQNDVYQYDYWVGLDPASGVDPGCSSVGSPLGGSNGDFVCRETLEYYSTRVYDRDSGESYRYLTLRNGFRETLYGGNFSYNIGERSEVGVTGYYSDISMLIAPSTDPVFSLSARYPQRPSFGAIGVNARYGYGMFDFSGEVSRTDTGGHATYLRALLNPTSWAEVAINGRNYSRDYDNPHSRAQAAPDELNGNRARNERGVGARASIKPSGRLELVSLLDVWENPWEDIYNPGGELDWRRPPEAVRDIRLEQRVMVRATSKETLRLQLRYANNDLNRNSREEVYASNNIDSIDRFGNFIKSEDGAGERRTVKLTASTTRLRRLTAFASYTHAWEDVASKDDSFDTEQRVRFKLTAKPWEGGSLVGSFAYWFHTPLSADAESDRQNPQMNMFVSAGHQFNPQWRLDGRVGMLRFNDSRDERYSTYHLSKMVLTAKF